MRVSIYAEVDKGGTQSDPNPPPSTALECLRACEASLREAAFNRETAERYWADGGRDNYVWEWTGSEDYKQIKRDKTGNAIHKRDKYGNRLYTEDGAVLHNDRARAIAEHQHWQGIAEWWRERAAEDPNKVRVFQFKEVA